MLFSSVEKLGNSYEKEPPVFCHLAGNEEILPARCPGTMWMVLFLVGRLYVVGNTREAEEVGERYERNQRTCGKTNSVISENEEYDHRDFCRTDQ